MRARYLIGQNASVEIQDRGLAYGDGLFETMAVRHGQIQRLELHLDRLNAGGQRLSLPLPNPDELKRRLDEVSGPLTHGHVKLTVTRGYGPRGYAPPDQPTLNVMLSATAGDPASARILDVVTLETRLGENPKLAGIKHLCRLEQVLGQLELRQHTADEGLMLSVSDHVIGGTSRNVFAAFGPRLVTPDLSRAGIAGVMRRAVLQECARQGIPVEEGTLTVADMHRADEVFMTNALVGIQSVGRIDDRALPSQALATLLRSGLAWADD